jgi:hypothetical protein
VIVQLSVQVFEPIKCPATALIFIVPAHPPTRFGALEEEEEEPPHDIPPAQIAATIRQLSHTFIFVSPYGFRFSGE